MVPQEEITSSQLSGICHLGAMGLTPAAPSINHKLNEVLPDGERFLFGDHSRVTGCGNNEHEAYQRCYKDSYHGWFPFGCLMLLCKPKYPIHYTIMRL
jgi:hypothetical protein